MPSQVSADALHAHPRAWGAVVPAKPLRSAKSRLATLGDEVRRDLVAAFLHDTVSAVLDARSISAVVVVTDDVVLAESAAALGALPVPDGHTDLNPSLVQGAAELLRRTPGVGVLAGCADLPALTGPDLDAWLAVARETPAAFVADAAGVGTTMLRASVSAAFTPAFGSGSRASHAGLGMRDLTHDAAPGLRHDVDTPEDLAALAAPAAPALGERTRWVITRHRL